jgi:hypothetical protein
VLGYGTVNNNYWVAEYGEIAKNKLTGVTSGVLPDGRSGKGTVSLVRVDDNTFEFHLDMILDGKKFSDVGKFSRKAK